MASESVPGKVFFGRPESARAIDQYRRAVGQGVADQQIEQYAVSRLRQAAFNADGSVNLNKLETWRRSHADALAKLPNLRQQVDELATSARAVADRSDAAARFGKDASKAAQGEIAEAARRQRRMTEAAQRSRLGKVMNADSGEEVVRQVGSIFGRSDAGREMLKLNLATRGNPEAREPVQAEGGAMPATVSRRFFLSRMGGAAAASALAAVPVAAESSPEENPELLDLGARFEAAHADYFATSERVSELQPAFRAMAPALPAEISGSEHERFDGAAHSDFYRDPASPKLEDVKGADGRRVRIISPYAVERNYRGQKMPKSIERQYRLALDFENATDAALKASGLAAALQAHHNADGALRRVIYDMSLNRIAR